MFKWIVELRGRSARFNAKVEHKATVIKEKYLYVVAILWFLVINELHSLYW